MCKVHLQYGNSTTKWPFYSFFRVNFTIFIIYSHGVLHVAHRVLHVHLLIQNSNSPFKSEILTRKSGFGGWKYNAPKNRVFRHVINRKVKGIILPR